MGLNLEAHYQGSQMIVGFVMAECAKLDEYNDLLMLGIQSMCPMVAYDPMEKLDQLAPPVASLFGGASWSWTLPSNNSSPCGRLENPANIVDLFDFPDYPLMNLLNNEALWLTPICQPRW